MSDTASDTGFESSGSSSDEVMEDLEERGVKRIHSDEDDAEGNEANGKKKRRLRKENELKKLHKPPTANELSRLRETENLYHSNLFRLQIEEMLKEVQIKEKHKKDFETWFDKFRDRILKMEDNEIECQLMDQKWLKNFNIKIPIVQFPYNVKGKYQFRKPHVIEVIGSYKTNCYVGPNVSVDVLIEMPKSFFDKGDYVNTRYFRKRALYLCEIAAHIQYLKDLVADVHFLANDSDTMRPLLEIVPFGKLGKKLTVLVHLAPEDGTFKLNRFNPDNNNVRPSWVFTGEDILDGKLPPTPQHNASILRDLTALPSHAHMSRLLGSHAPLLQGLILLKVWLRQRELHLCLSGHQTAMLLCYLLSVRRLSANMSCYQVFRTFCSFLASTDWSTPLSLHTAPSPPPQDSALPPLSVFPSHHPCTLLDPTGHHNLLAGVTKADLTVLRHEASLALRALDNPSIDSFKILFMTPVPFYRQYDHLILFHNKEALETLAEVKGRKPRQLDFIGTQLPLYRDILLDTLAAGFGERVTRLAARRTLQRWPTRRKPNHRAGGLVVGVALNGEACLSLLDKAKGEGQEAEAFREFWGERSELRRFQDGSITEAVVWKADSLSDKRVIVEQVTQYLCHTRLGLEASDVLYIARQLEASLPSALDEACLAVCSSFDALGKQLRGLKGLPLEVVGVQPSSPALRYTDGAPPAPRLKSRPVAPPPVQGVVQLGPSNKWPRHRDAVRRLRAAFCVKIVQELRDKCRLQAQPHAEGVEVVKDGYTFQLFIYYPGEVAMLKQSKDSEGLVKFRDTPESLQLERKGSELPRLTSALHGLHTQHNSYGAAARLAHRFLSSHMLDGHVPREALELLVAAVYLKPGPLPLPQAPQAAFLSFLSLVHATDWAAECLVLNFNDEMNRDEVLQIETHFTGQRDSLPTVFIATPQHRNTSPWTINGPTPLILLRLMELCRSTAELLEKRIYTKLMMDSSSIFQPSLSAYDIIIHLNYLATPPGQELDRSSTPGGPPRGRKKPRSSRNSTVLDFNPATCYLQDLRDCYDEVALFFHDPYNPAIVAAVWKPAALKPRPFKTNHVDSRIVARDNAAILTLNLPVILEDLFRLGEGLVLGLEVKQEGKFVQINCIGDLNAIATSS